MKLLFAAALAGLATFAAPQMGHAAVYAGHLQMVANGNGTYDLSYRLNEDANQGVVINIKGPGAGGPVVRTISVATQTKGKHTVTWDGKNNAAAAVPNGTYTWEVVASTNNPGTGYVKNDLGSTNQTVFGIPYGLAVDKNTTSPYFGTVYVANRGPADAGRPTENGIYVLSNDFEDITGQGDVAYKGGAGFVYPYEIFVAPSSEVFIADNADVNSNVFIMDPANPSGTFSRLFTDAGRDADGLNATNGTVYALYVEGTGNNTVLYTMDEDLNNPGSAWKYNIGSVRSGYSGTPEVLYDDGANGNLVINFSGEIHKDTNPNRTGWFLSQTRDNENAGAPNYFHFNGTTVDWKSSVDFDFWLNQNYYASFDLNRDSTRFVAAGFKWVQVVDISDLQNMNDDSILYSDIGANTVHRDIRFDPVENFILAANTTERLYYYSKLGSNTFTTPNPDGAAITIGPASVSGWELY